MRGARPDHAFARELMQAVPYLADARVVVGVSGGSDSVALIALLTAAFPAVQATLVHVNHRLRASASQDEAVVGALAAQLDLPFRSVHVEPRAADEAHLRTLRYDVLGEAARALDAPFVLTGHTAQDQTETVLMALFRGTGRDGLCGMPVRRRLCARTELVRPLLRYDRLSLQGYCERRRLPYAVDPSNGDDRYTRNALRRQLVALRGSFPGLDRAVARCAHILQEEREGSELAKTHAAVRAALHAAGMSGDITYERIAAAARMLQLSGGRTVRVEQEER